MLQLFSVHYQTDLIQALKDEIAVLKGNKPKPQIKPSGMEKNADDLFNNEDSWRENYWSFFYRDITCKTKDWEYENEYRLILSNKEKPITLEYEFKFLHGIIFGINTSDEDKIEIMNIIDAKCKKSDRDDFKFYQAYYSVKKKHIDHKELSLVKVNK